MGVGYTVLKAMASLLRRLSARRQVLFSLISARVHMCLPMQQRTVYYNKTKKTSFTATSTGIVLTNNWIIVVVTTFTLTLLLSTSFITGDGKRASAPDNKEDDGFVLAISHD